MKTTALAVTVLCATLLFTGCSKKGCIDPQADNYDMDAKKDDGSCTYPSINVQGSGGSGDVTGSGGTVEDSYDWENGEARTELNMDLTAASGGKFRVVVKDADGTEVLDEELEVGVGDDSLTKCSAEGTPGTWEVKISLTDFDGDGSFTLNQGC